MRTELTKRIFAACMLVVALTIGLVMVAVNGYAAQRDAEELRSRAAYLAAGMDRGGPEDSVMQAARGVDRITLIAPDGRVLYDSEQDAARMENHASREEVHQALLSGEGSSERISETLTRKTVYFARRLENGNVLRVSMVKDSVLVLALHLVRPMTAILVIMVALSVWLASRTSKRIMKPINAMDVENPDDRDIYDEMKPFIHRLIRQNQQIHRQMEELKAEHRKQDTMRREFTANVSHELKTPLTSISGFAEIIRDGMVQEKDIPHFADNIYQEAQRLIALVADILKLSRLEDADAQREERKEVSLLTVCEDVADRLSLNAAQAGIALTCTGEQVRIHAAPNLLGEVIYNVCDNAIKYNRPGGFVRITVNREEGGAVVRVTDNGIGIPAADRERVFERFYRVNKSHSKEVGGTGLGLSIVKHGMAVHGGSVSLRSVPGEGTEVTLTFPS